VNNGHRSPLTGAIRRIWLWCNCGRREEPRFKSMGGYMVHAHDALRVLQGLLVLALLWWTWSSLEPRWGARTVTEQRRRKYACR
jgi:hypothetical protein